MLLDFFSIRCLLEVQALRVPLPCLLTLSCCNIISSSVYSISRPHVHSHAALDMKSLHMWFARSWHVGVTQDHPYNLQMQWTLASIFLPADQLDQASRQLTQSAADSEVPWTCEAFPVWQPDRPQATCSEMPIIFMTQLPFIEVSLGTVGISSD